MSGKLRLSIGDVLHRGVVYTLVGISVWGVYMIGVVHFETLRRGRGNFFYRYITTGANVSREALALQAQTPIPEVVPKPNEDEVKERALAELAQQAFRRTSDKSS